MNDDLFQQMMGIGQQKRARKNLLGNAEQKIRTAFIGAISQFEQAFGNIWGHGQPELNLLTANQRKWRAVWNEVRKRILDNGNNQIRLLQKEISQHTIRKDKQL